MLLKNKIQPKTLNCVAWKMYQWIGRSVKMNTLVQKSLWRNPFCLGTASDGVSCD